MKKILCMSIGLFLVMGISAWSSTAAETKNPYLKPDETWISISGTAVDTRPDAFYLDYGKGVIMVEMDGWSWYAGVFKKVDGDKVTVYGRIDDDLFETTTIEASSVYDQNMGTYFFANPADEEYEDDYAYWLSGVVVPGWMEVRGTVTSVDGRQFTIDAGPRKLTVDTTTLSYNPLDKSGFQKIEKGDYVKASGYLEVDFWEGRMLKAESLIEVVDD